MLINQYLYFSEKEQIWPKRKEKVVKRKENKLIARLVY
jgi:hypothetical protein